MAFQAQTDHKESLQTLAMALRQQKGADLEPAELTSAMKNLGSIAAPVKKHCAIDYSKMFRDFNVWLQFGAEDWVDSSVWIANSVYPKYCSSGTYNFYRQDFVPAFKGTYKHIKDKIKRKAKAPVLKKMYKIVGMSEDKWNPSDIIAIKSSTDSQTINLIKDFDASKVSKESATARKQTMGMKGDMIHVMEDLDEMYEYNQLIDGLFKKKECIGISLKKSTSSSVKLDVIDHKADKGLKKALSMKVDITKVDYLPTNQKCLVYFTLAGEKGHYLDIRGFETTQKIADVQVQLSKKGSSAAHGKITLPVVTLITKLSKGRAALSALNAKKRSLFKSLPQSSIHSFTGWNIFNSYANDPEKLKEDMSKWANYIQWLSKNRHESFNVMRHVEKLLSKKSARTTGVFDAAKYLKHKVQSYEVGFLLDTSQKQIKEDIKENIIKSMISYAGSKGMMIFKDSKATAYMVSSSYLKAGG